MRLGLVAAIATALLLTMPPPVSAAFVQSFRAYGQGHEPSITPDCSALCPVNDTCACTPIQGKGNASLMGSVSFTATVATDVSQAVGQCFELFATALLTSTTTPTNKLAVDFAGTLCATPDANVVNATYTFNPTASKGAFKGATGSGNLTGSRDMNVLILGSMIGTIKLP
jgi:hypothetical protein